MKIFLDQNLLSFAERFKTDEDCKEYLCHIKCDKGYKCRKSGHTKSQIRKNLARCSIICCNIESPTADTLFHKLKFGLRKTFFICFEMATTTKSLSASQVSVRYGIRESSARLFIHKVREAMKSSGNNPRPCKMMELEEMHSYVVIKTTDGFGLVLIETPEASYKISCN